MSIANKLTYLAGTKAALRDAINAAGGGIGTAETFRSYAGGWLRDQGATLDLQFWCERFIARRRGNMTPSAVGFNNIVTFTRASTGGVFNEFGQYVQRAVNEWRNDHDPATLTTSTSTANFDSNTATFTLPTGHAFFVGDLFRATAVSGSLWGVVTARSDTSVTVYVRNTSGSGSASSWTCIKPLGILIEEQRTNLLLQSGSPSLSPWISDSVVLGSSTVGPFGAETPVYETAVSAFFRLRQQQVSSVIAGNTYTYKFKIKKLGRRYVFIRTQARNLSNENIGFDLDALTTTFTPSGWSASIRILSNGVCELTATCTASVSNAIVHGILSSNASITSNNLNNYVGEPDKGFVYISGQLEAGPFHTSYIPTEVSQVTRAADVASVNAFSPWYNAGEGAVFVDAVTQNSGVRVAATLSDGSLSNRIQITRTPSSSGAAVVVSGAVQADLNRMLGVRSALSYALDDFRFCSGGGDVIADSSASVPSISALRVGAYPTSSAYLNGHVRSIRYFPRRLSDSELQELTA